MTRPKYSVVIPTRDRPALTKIAVTTVLRQSFEDWELVVSDNSENEDTREMMRAFEDPRIRYLRVRDLSMCDNWEHACEHAEGDYFCVLEDKQALKFHALARIDQIVQQEDPEVVRWQWDSLDPYGFGHRVRRSGARGGVHHLSADESLACLVDRSYMEAKHRLPLPHYSAIRRDVIEKIRQAPIGRLFPPVSPDYTLAIQVLNFCERVTYIDEGLVCFSDVSVSHGLSMRMKTELARKFVESLGEESVFYDHVPVKARTVEGSIYNDYVKLREKLGGRLERHPPNWANYFFACHDAIQSSVALGVDMSAELTEWERALPGQSEDVRRDIAARIRKARKRRESVGRRIRKSRPVKRFMRGAKSLLSGRILRREDWRFSHILDYLEHESRRN